MSTRLVLFAGGLMLATVLVGAGLASDAPAVPPRDGVFVHISKAQADPHAVLMGLKMANLMAADHDVLVYFDLAGVEVVLKDAPDLTFRTFDSAQTQLKTLLDKGVPVYVCPGCLKAAGKEPGDVRPGVKIAEKEAFFNFTKGRILSMDY